MASYELSETAKRQIAEIYEYSIAEFGQRVARRYLNGLHDVCGLLANQPGMGRDVSDVRSGVRRQRYQSHIIYYEPAPGGVRILDIVHHAQDALRRYLE